MFARLLLFLALLGVAFTGCEPSIHSPLPDAGDDAGTDPDAGEEEEEEVDDPHAEAKIDWNFGAPIEAPLETWTYVPIEGAKCGNGTDTGIAVNLSDRSDDVVIFLAPGGACWDGASCLFLKLATHLEDTMQGEAVVAEAQSAQLAVLFDRVPENPMRDLSFVYVPYCTGDVHAGTRVAHYSFQDNARNVHHVGGTNILRILERLVPTFPDATRVWFTGASAGGFGATYNWWVAQDAFPDARVDVLDDGAAPVDFDVVRFGQMMTTWDPVTPPGCPRCRRNLSELLPYYAERYPPPHRYALLTSARDTVITMFSGIGADAFEARVGLLRDATGSGQKTFFIPGDHHVLLSLNPPPVSPDGVSALDWLEQFFTDDPAWEHQGVTPGE